MKNSMLNKNLYPKRPYSKEHIKKYALNYLNKFNANTEYLKMFLVNKIKRKFLVKDLEILKEETNNIILELTNKGFINDITYSEFRIKYLLKTGNSTFNINLKLKQKNISQNIIDTAWNNILNSNNINEAELYSLVKYAKKRNVLLWQNKNEITEEEYQKHINSLLRKGFDYDLIKNLLIKDNDINNSQEAYENFTKDIEIKFNL